MSERYNPDFDRYGWESEDYGEDYYDYEPPEDDQERGSFLRSLGKFTLTIGLLAGAGAVYDQLEQDGKHVAAVVRYVEGYDNSPPTRNQPEGNATLPTSPSSLEPRVVATPAKPLAPKKPDHSPSHHATASRKKEQECKTYKPTRFGVNPNNSPYTGNGSQLVTVIARSHRSHHAKFVAWEKHDNGCWAPAKLAGQPPQPFKAGTGAGGLIPLKKRVPGDGATPIGVFKFGAKMYGNSSKKPSHRYPYHHLKCGDWWNELAGSPNYDRFRHVECGTTPHFASSAEALWTIKGPYQHFIPLKMPNPPDHAAGIFLHDATSSGTTAGCIELPNKKLNSVLRWLKPGAKPHIRIGVR